MKNYILTLLFALVALTSCNNDEYYYYKTPGEITGEKIIEMVVENNWPPSLFLATMSFVTWRDALPSESFAFFCFSSSVRFLFL